MKTARMIEPLFRVPHKPAAVGAAIAIRTHIAAAIEGRFGVNDSNRPTESNTAAGAGDTTSGDDCAVATRRGRQYARS